MWKNRLKILLPLLVLFALETPLAAQYIPGGSHRENRARFDQRLAGYRTYVLEGVNEAMDEWKNAWMDGDLESLAELYMDDAVLSPPGGGFLARTAGEIQRYLADMVTNTERISADVFDFDVDDMMAYVLGHYELRLKSTDGTYAGTQKGLFMAVYKLDGGTWKIRSQLFRLDA
jgi:ketosteroid isomerase-like protein